MADAGRILIMPKGTYDSTVSYERLDLVKHNETVWLAKKDVVGIEPNESNSEYWFAMMGSDATSLGGKTADEWQAEIDDIINGTTTVAKATNAVIAMSANSADTVSWEGVTDKPSEYTPEAHTQDASTITAGTFGGKVQGNQTAMATLATSQFRDIFITSSNITEGSSSTRANGTIVFTKG